MTLKNPEIPVEDNPKRIRVCEIPADGICFLYPDGHEEYVRACPKCGHRLETSRGHGRMPKWVCPVARFDKRCSWPGEPMASMSRCLASELSDVIAPEVCPKCNKTNFITEIHRRLDRVEIVLRHPGGDPCTAQVHFILHTFSSAKMEAQTWDDEPDKFRKMLQSLPVVTPAEADRMVRESESVPMPPVIGNEIEDRIPFKSNENPGEGK